VDRRRTLLLCAWTAAAALAVGLLSRDLPPEGFSSGDSGLKLIVARHAAAEPSRPFAIDLPAIAGAPVPFVDPMFQVHGEHAHALQAPLFPLLIAPLVAWLGLRGAYLLPAMAFIALLPLTAALSRRLGLAVGVTPLVVSAVLANPALFYAFEIWDHVPAIAVLAGATVLAFGEAGARGDAVRLGAAGLLAAIGILLRPEAIWYAVALGATLMVPRRMIGYAAGAVLVLVPFAAANYLEGGTLAGPHATANLSALSDRWASVRLERLSLWLAPASLWFAAGIAGLVVAWAVRRWNGDPRRAQAIGLAAACVIAVAGALERFPAPALWSAWPLGVLLLVPAGDARLRRLHWLVAASTLGIWLTSTHDGGAQWGPRFLLIATPAFLVLAAAALHETTSAGRLRRVRVSLVAVIVLAGAWTSRHAVLDLRGVKRFHARLVAGIDRQVPPGAYVVSNIAWIDQIAASSSGTRTWLIAAPPEQPRAVLERLERSGVRTISVVWSTDPVEPGPLSLDGSCYRLRDVVEVPERLIAIGRADCVPPVSRPLSHERP
jgi:hypothetical protein